MMAPPAWDADIAALVGRIGPRFARAERRIASQLAEANGTSLECVLVTHRRALGLALVTGAGGLLLAACGGSAPATSAPQAVATAAPALTATAPVVAPTVAATAPAMGARATTAATTTGKVNANTASKAELTAAFQAAGIPSPDRRAQEVTEYHPYPTDDPTFAKLRSNLANPA